MNNVQARTVLWYLTFFGFAINYMIRINLNITIVEMSDNINIRNSYLLISDDKYFARDSFNLSEIIEKRINLSENNETNLLFDNMGKTLFVKDKSQGFAWNEYEQGLVLGSFFWAHWLTQLPGGMLAKKYGTKLVFGLSNAVGCWLCILIPLSSYYDYRLLICVRVLQGLITGLSWPAMHSMTAKWIPPNERSKFVTAYLGSSVGTALFYPLFGYIMHWMSWLWVYYICSIVGTIWWLFWLLLVYDSPAQHPRISIYELIYIEKSLGNTAQQIPNARIPWKSILISRQVWINIVGQWGGIWGLFTLMTQAPTYFRVLHNWDIRTIGFLSGLPHLMRMAFAFVFSILADYLLTTNRMTRTNVRKFAMAVCCILMGLIVLILAYWGQNSLLAIVLITVATMFHGAVSSGTLASIVDIAPNYAGIVLGICGTITILPGVISPYIVGLITFNNQNFEAWKNVFLITATMLISSGILYVCYGDSSLQKWNGHNINQENVQHYDKEMQLIEE